MQTKNSTVPYPMELLRQSPTYLIGLLSLLVVSIAVRLIFWLWTKWTIEDAMIIGRMARQFAGHGVLSFNTSSVVSSATSPLFALATGLLTYAGLDPIVAAKLLGLAASSLTVLLIYDLLYAYHPGKIAVVGGIIYAFLPPSVAYSVGGMETPVYTLFCALAIERLIRNRCGESLICAAIATLLRPDGALVFVLVSSGIIWRIKQKAVVPSPSWGLVFVLFAFGIGAHKIYYGALVPHSMFAKGIGYHVDPIANSLRYLQRLLFSQPGGFVIYLLAAWGGWKAVKRERDFLLPIAWYLLYYAAFMLRAPLFDWYLQPPLWVLGLFAGIGLIEILRCLSESPVRRRMYKPGVIVVSLGLSIVLLGACLLYASGRRDMAYYEESVRGAAGRWLRSNTHKEELVFTESLGYIGYYTDNPFVDWPGLVTREVPGLLAKTGTHKSRREGYNLVIRTYQPRYLVLRDEEWTRLAADIKVMYIQCARFPASKSSDTSYLIAFKP